MYYFSFCGIIALVIYMKKTISVFITVLILLLTLLNVTTFAKDIVQLKLTDATVYAGDEFILKLFISDNSELSGAVIDFTYDSNLLEFISADKGTILDESASINIKNFDEKSFVRFTYMSPSSSISSAGILVSIKFKALESAEGRTLVKISIPNAGDFVNSELEKISYTVENSNVRIINSTHTETTEVSTSETLTESETSVTEILSKTETTTELVPEQNDNQNDDNTKVVIGLFVTGFLLLLGAIVCSVINKRKKR